MELEVFDRQQVPLHEVSDLVGGVLSDESRCLSAIHIHLDLLESVGLVLLDEELLLEGADLDAARDLEAVDILEGALSRRTCIW